MLNSNKDTLMSVKTNACFRQEIQQIKGQDLEGGCAVDAAGLIDEVPGKDGRIFAVPPPVDRVDAADHCRRMDFEGSGFIFWFQPPNTKPLSYIPL